MVNQVVHARNVNLEVHNSGTAGRNQSRLNVFVNQCAAFNTHFVENLADHVERRHQVRTAVTDKDTHFVAHIGFQGIIAGNRAYAAVEDHIVRLFADGFFHIERLQAGFAVFTFGVEVALYHIELFIHRRQAFFRLNQYQTVHTVGNVHAHRRSGTVVNIQTRLQGFEAERAHMARCSK